MSALILFVFAVLMFIGSLTLPVSPDKLVFEFGALALLGTAAFRAHSFGAPGFAPKKRSNQLDGFSFAIVSRSRASTLP